MIEIRRNPDGSVDEVCAPGVHLEQMDDSLWVLTVEDDEERVLIFIGAKHAPASLTVIEVERTPKPDPFAGLDPDLLTEAGLGGAGETKP